MNIHVLYIIIYITAIIVASVVPQFLIQDSIFAAYFVHFTCSLWIKRNRLTMNTQYEYIHTCTCMSTYIHVYVCVCVCMCAINVTHFTQQSMLWVDTAMETNSNIRKTLINYKTQTVLIDIQTLLLPPF